jgi:hypothetical protein
MNKLRNEQRNEDRPAALSPDGLNPDALDRILLEDALVPSSGFAASVMQAIEEQAVQPAPIPFPWKLALPGLVALLVVVVVAVRLIVTSLHSSATINLDSTLVQTIGRQAGTIVLALAGAFACLVLTQRLAGGRPAR